MFIPEHFLLPLFVFVFIFSFSLSIIFRRFSIVLLILFIFVTGIFCSGYQYKNQNNKLPVSAEKIVAAYGQVKDVREKGPLILVVLENTMVYDGNQWFNTGIKASTLIPDSAGVYVSDWLYLVEIKKITPYKDKHFTISAKSWVVVESNSWYSRFNQKMRFMAERLVKKYFKYYGQEAAIFKMMVLGDKRQSLEIKDVFIKTGTYHLLIVSGIHLGYLILFLRIIFFPLRRFEQPYYKVFNLLYLVTIFLYAGITGFSTPVVRAGLMFGLFLLSEIIERPISGIDSIGWAASLILFLNPDELFNLGFQLSFAATTGIVLFMRNVPQIKKIPEWLDSTIKTIAGAQLFTMPVLAANTGIFYPIGFFTNFLLVPVGGIAVFLGFAFIIFGFLRFLIIFPLIKMIQIFWLTTKIFSNFSPQVSFIPDIFLILSFYFLIFALIFRKNWKIFLSFSFLTIFLHFLPLKSPEKVEKIFAEWPSKVEESITIFPCKKLLCVIEKEKDIIIISSVNEYSKLLEPLFENMADKNKNLIIYFLDTGHDIIRQVEIFLKHIKPSMIVDSPEIRKKPEFGYRKCFYLSDMKIKQNFWKFLIPFENIRLVYNEKNRQVIEYRSKKGTILISTYMNSKIFESLPFSPSYHTIYATELSYSKKIKEYFQQYQIKQVIYQKLKNCDSEKIDMAGIKSVKISDEYYIDFMQ